MTNNALIESGVTIFENHTAGALEVITFVPIPPHARNVSWAKSILTNAAISCEIQLWIRAKNPTGFFDHSGSVITVNNSVLVGNVSGFNNINCFDAIRVRYQGNAGGPTRFYFKFRFWTT